MTAPAGRIPPHDLTTERAVLACVMLDNAALDEVQGVLLPADFYGRANATIFAAMIELGQKQRPIDIVTLRARLVDDGSFEGVGGDETLVALTDHLPAVESVEDRKSTRLNSSH